MSCPEPGRATLPVSVFHETPSIVQPNPRRPHLPMEPPPRRFLCACCRTPVLVCSRCDHGNRYCKDCAAKARPRCVKAAGERYQASRRGRHAHAQRQRRWRAKRAKVTHQGSPPPGLPALLPPEVAVIEVEAPQQLWPCHFCQGNCAELVRIDFLRRRIRRPQRLHNQKEDHHARDP